MDFFGFRSIHFFNDRRRAASIVSSTRRRKVPWQGFVYGKTMKSRSRPIAIGGIPMRWTSNILKPGLDIDIFFEMFFDIIPAFLE